MTKEVYDSSDDKGVASTENDPEGTNKLDGGTENDGDGVPLAVPVTEGVGEKEELAPADSDPVGVDALEGVAELEGDGVPLAVPVTDGVGEKEGLAPTDSDPVGVDALEGDAELEGVCDCVVIGEVEKNAVALTFSDRDARSEVELVPKSVPVPHEDREFVSAGESVK